MRNAKSVALVTYIITVSMLDAYVVGRQGRLLQVGYGRT